MGGGILQKFKAIVMIWAGMIVGIAAVICFIIADLQDLKRYRKAQTHTK